MVHLLKLADVLLPLLYFFHELADIALQLVFKLNVGVGSPSLYAPLFYEEVHSTKNFVPVPLGSSLPIGVLAEGVELLSFVSQGDHLAHVLGSLHVSIMLLAVLQELLVSLHRILEQSLPTFLKLEHCLVLLGLEAEDQILPPVDSSSEFSEE